MSGFGTDKVFSGSIPKLYETHLVPLIFEPYAADLAKRLASRSLTRVLEIAAGTGVVTRSLASALPESVSIVATDLNQPMLDQAAALGTKRPVEWRQADAMRLPFRDGMFDADLQTGQDRLLLVRGRLGELLQRADSISSLLQDRSVAGQQALSQLTDLDMVRAISEFQTRQMGLQAALQSYGQVQRLSLFQFIA